jgi:hypothetical protein
VTKEMADFSAIKTFTSQKLSFFSIFSKSQKPIKAIIRHLPSITLAEKICGALVELSFDVISIKQMTTTRKFPHFLDSRLTDGGKAVSLTRRPPFTPQEYSWYSFLLHTELTPGP